jgi:hypothetical protein
MISVGSGGGLSMGGAGCVAVGAGCVSVGGAGCVSVGGGVVSTGGGSAAAAVEPGSAPARIIAVKSERASRDHRP